MKTKKEISIQLLYSLLSQFVADGYSGNDYLQRYAADDDYKAIVYYMQGSLRYLLGVINSSDDDF